MTDLGISTTRDLYLPIVASPAAYIWLVFCGKNTTRDLYLPNCSLALGIALAFIRGLRFADEIKRWQNNEDCIHKLFAGAGNVLAVEVEQNAAHAKLIERVLERVYSIPVAGIGIEQAAVAFDWCCNASRTGCADWRRCI